MNECPGYKGDYERKFVEENKPNIEYTFIKYEHFMSNEEQMEVPNYNWKRMK